MKDLSKSDIIHLLWRKTCSRKKEAFCARFTAELRITAKAIFLLIH